jgi:hypothetical protein
MIIHQDIGVQGEGKAVPPFFKQLQEMKAIAIVQKDRAAFDAASSEVIPNARMDDAQRPSHATRTSN